MTGPYIPLADSLMREGRAFARGVFLGMAAGAAIGIAIATIGITCLIVQA